MYRLIYIHTQNESYGIIHFLSTKSNFFNLMNSSTYSGSGLSLATCKKIIERYGSALEVVSVID